MGMHRGACALGVVRGNGVHDGGVFGDGRAPGRLGFKIIAEPLEQRPAACIPEGLHGFDQHNVAGALHNGRMECAITIEGHRVRIGVAHHGGQRHTHGIDVFAASLGCGNGGDLAFDHASRTNQLQRAPFAQGNGRVARQCATAIQHVHARACAHLHPAFHFQRNQGFAHRWAAHAQLFGQVALGRQTAARQELPRRDERAQLFGNLLVQALGRHGLQGHGSTKR